MTFLIWRQIRQKFEHDVSSVLEKDLGLQYNLTEVLLDTSSFKKSSILAVPEVREPLIVVLYSTILEFLVFIYSRVGILTDCRNFR